MLFRILHNFTLNLRQYTQTTNNYITSMTVNIVMWVRDL